MWVRTSARRYISYLKKCGVKIGDNFRIFNDVRTIEIDLTRPSLITIGKNVAINRNFSLLTHDFVSGVFLNLYSDFVPSSGAVVIGNNVAIGANAVVTNDVPDNACVAGVPARIINMKGAEGYVNNKV